MKSVSACALALAAIGAPAMAQDSSSAAEVSQTASPAVEQLRHVIGEWDVTTTFYRPDGSVAGTADGAYSFQWVQEDAVVQGLSTIPRFGMASGILFYVRPATEEIEMVSVGKDGQLWTMTGPMDAEARETPVVANPDGSTIKLRFTRFNVTPDSFESRMERSADGGATWERGNHQTFTRRKGADRQVLDALRPLAGACWSGTFGEGPAYDIMCVEEMAGGSLKSRHMVRGITGSYSGETIYFADPATGTTRFVYFTSLGAIQRGTVKLEDGRILFPDMVYHAADGARLQMRGSGELLADGSYRATTSQYRGGTWLAPSELVMTRIACADWDAVVSGCDR